MVYYKWKRKGSISLGFYIIVSDERVLFHELGHRKQSQMLGPLYLLVIGLPSFIWATLHSYTSLSSRNYYAFYTEAWAEHLAEDIKRTIMRP